LRILIRVLGIVLVLALAVAVVEVVHPKGVLGLWRDLTSRAPAPAPAARQGTAPAPTPVPETPKAPSEFWGPGAEKQIGWGERDFDRGDFDGAVSNLTAARVLAANPTERANASKALEKALLGWALVKGAPKVPGKAADLEKEYLRRLAPTEQLRDEKAWTDLVRWTAGAGLRERLPYVVQQTLDCAKPGGFAQGQIEAVAQDSGSRRELIRAALASRGLVKGTPLAALPASPMSDSGVRTAPESSGIGGINEKGIPFGRFSAATREKLREGIRLERQGTTAYEAAGPDSPNRAENRHSALRLLQQARDIYVAAQSEDSESRDLDERMKHVMQMIAQLRKDEGIGR
jgi:hypothetical protein